MFSIFGHDDPEEPDDKTTLTIIKSCFLVFFLFEAFIAGILPGSIPWCRKSVNMLGIVNSFAGGVFIAVALTHIMPEAANDYNEYMEHDHDHSLRHGDEEIFPLPFVLVFVGYFLLLLIDKVLFDTHSLMDHGQGHEHGPEESPHVHSSFVKIAKQQKEGNKINQSDLDDSIKHYLNRADRFVSRLSNSVRKSDARTERARTFVGRVTHESLKEQHEHFVDKDNVGFEDADL